MQSASLFDLIMRHIGVYIALVVVVMIGWNLWVTYLNMLYLRSIDWIMLEIVPPKDVFKSPAAMELVFNALHGGGSGNWYEKYWKGELAQYYSLEIVSTEGKVHFYVRFHKKFRKVFEAQLYAQYPQAEVKEVEDYTKKIPNSDFKKNSPISMFAYNLKLEKADPYPIKTYVDFGLDKAIGSLEEEQRIDPMTPTIETMGSIGIGEHIWVQINIRQAIKRHEVKKGDAIEKEKSWKDKSREVIEEIKSKANTKDAEGKTVVGKLGRGEQGVIEAIERHRNKPGFDTGIRVLYIADKEHFSGNTITAFTSMWRQYNTEDLNAWKMSDLTKVTEPWKDITLKETGSVVSNMKKGYLDDYKSRSFFYGGFSFDKIGKYFTHPEASGSKGFVLSSEELATIYHLPGRVAETPNVLRVESKKGEPPANLPI
ncbi:MAG: hypothetical protein KBB91_00165 [Candidatus Pacebacteria bacterium]|jgi:hypothetical protein|nr:hypothetical protein [Candidatus Paceibacterota bacterium]MBP9700807.1 hypothetical protein [Candidatus Paceibacterota bacterium]